VRLPTHGTTCIALDLDLRHTWARIRVRGIKAEVGIQRAILGGDEIHE